MNKITVVNLRNCKADFICDRSSPLGNPFPMRKEFHRDSVCEKYEEYFYNSLSPDISPKGFLEFLSELQLAHQERNITLGCWCAPKRCHCDTIKEWLENNHKAK